MNLTARVDRPLAADVVSHDRRRRVLQIALPLLVVALLIAWLPGWLRPSIPRARLRTARVTTGPIEAAIMATGTVVPEVERVLSSPLDARVLRILVRPGAQLEVGAPVVELDISESVLALEKIVKDLKVKENQQAQSRLTLEKSLVDLVGKIDVKLSDAVLSIRDSGPGFDPKDLPHVFDRFYRAEKARGLPGSGLGLAIVRQTAEAHGGYVRATNDPEGGARLDVFFGGAPHSLIRSS